MRIRSTKPEFWRSERIAGVSWDARLVLKGLESYVDDNGVGKDDIALIVGDLFQRDLVRESSGSPREGSGVLARVSEAISELSEGGLLHRYEADGTRLLFVAFWEQVQRIDKPSPGRFPRPDGTLNFKDSKIRESSGSPRESSRILAPGTGEQGNRGTGEQGSSVAHTRARLTPVNEPPDNGDPPTTTQTVLRQFVDWLNTNNFHQPASQVRTALSTQVKKLLGEETPEDILAGLQLWQTKGANLGAGLLPNLVHEARSRPANGNRRQAETDNQFDRLLSRAAERDQQKAIGT